MGFFMQFFQLFSRLYLEYMQKSGKMILECLVLTIFMFHLTEFPFVALDFLNIFIEKSAWKAEHFWVKQYLDLCEA